MRRLALAAALGLVGCSTFSIAPLNHQLAGMVGQPVEQAFHQLGYPDRQEVIAGRTVYYWGGDQADCQIKVVSTSDGRVASGSIYGSPAGCRHFVH